MPVPDFLTSPGFVAEVVAYAKKSDVVVFPGALTPTEDRGLEGWLGFRQDFPIDSCGGRPIRPRSKSCATPDSSDRQRRRQSTTAFDFILAEWRNRSGLRIVAQRGRYSFARNIVSRN